jgi:hypothetical protein
MLTPERTTEEVAKSWLWTRWIWAFIASGPLPDAMEPGFHCVRTHWIRGFIAFQLVRRAWTVMLMVPVWPEPGFGERAARLRGMSRPAAGNEPPGCGY